MCYNEIGLCPQNIDAVLGSIVNITERVDVIDYNERESLLRPLQFF